MNFEGTHVALTERMEPDYGGLGFQVGVSKAGNEDSFRLLTITWISTFGKRTLIRPLVCKKDDKTGVWPSKWQSQFSSSICEFVGGWRLDPAIGPAQDWQLGRPWRNASSGWLRNALSSSGP